MTILPLIWGKNKIIKDPVVVVVVVVVSFLSFYCGYRDVFQADIIRTFHFKPFSIIQCQLGSFVQLCCVVLFTCVVMCCLASHDMPLVFSLQYILFNASYTIIIYAILTSTQP